VEWALLIIIGAWAYFLVQRHQNAIMQRLRLTDEGGEEKETAAETGDRL